MGQIAKNLNDMLRQYNTILDFSNRSNTVAQQHELQMQVYNFFRLMEPLSYDPVTIPAPAGLGYSSGKSEVRLQQWFRIKYSEHYTYGSPVGPQEIMLVVTRAGDQFKGSVRNAVRNIFGALVDQTKLLKEFDGIEISKKIGDKTGTEMGFTRQASQRYSTITSIKASTKSPSSLYFSLSGKKDPEHKELGAVETMIYLEDMLDETEAFYREMYATVEKIIAHNAPILKQMEHTAGPLKLVRG